MFTENEIASAFWYSVDRANDKILNTKHVFHFCKNLENVYFICLSPFITL